VQFEALPAWKNGRKYAPVFEVQELLLSVVSWFTETIRYMGDSFQVVEDA
jgi:hypothetical protein